MIHCQNTNSVKKKSILFLNETGKNSDSPKAEDAAEATMQQRQRMRTAMRKKKRERARRMRRSVNPALHSRRGFARASSGVNPKSDRTAVERTPCHFQQRLRRDAVSGQKDRT
jgi:hypothetical protein